jgi:hypothetical protein
MNHQSSLPDIVLERYRLGELSPDEAARVSAQVERDPLVRDRLTAIERSDAEFAAGGVAHRLETGARDRLERRRSRVQGSPGGLVAVWAVPVVVVAAAILFIVGPRGIVQSGVGVPAAVDAGDRVKGLQPALTVYRRTADGSETLADGAVAHPGDLLRLGYRAAGRPYGAILSIDDRGAVTLHLPDRAERAVALRRESTVLLDRSYELDDAPKWERFYLITGSEPFAVAPIVDAARRIGTVEHPQPAALPLPAGLEQTSFTIQKETRP